MIRHPPRPPLFPYTTLFGSKTCPRLFRGQTAVTEPLGSGWARYYAGLDARLEAYADRVVLNRYRLAKEVELGRRSEEHTSELQSQSNLVCRLLLEKKKCIVM